MQYLVVIWNPTFEHLEQLADPAPSLHALANGRGRQSRRRKISDEWTVVAYEEPAHHEQGRDHLHDYLGQIPADCAHGRMIIVFFHFSRMLASPPSNSLARKKYDDHTTLSAGESKPPGFQAEVWGFHSNTSLSGHLGHLRTSLSDAECFDEWHAALKRVLARDEAALAVLAHGALGLARTFDLDLQSLKMLPARAGHGRIEEFIERYRKRCEPSEKPQPFLQVLADLEFLARGRAALGPSPAAREISEQARGHTIKSLLEQPVEDRHKLALLRAAFDPDGPRSDDRQSEVAGFLKALDNAAAKRDLEGFLSVVLERAEQYRSFVLRLEAALTQLTAP